MQQEKRVLHYKMLWLLIGYAMIAFVVMQSLTSSPVSVGFELSDKLYHVVGYFGLMGWFVQIYHSKFGRLVWGVFFIAMGISLEFLQGMGGVRHFEVNDMIANATGVIIAWVLSGTVFSSCLLLIEKTVLKKTD